MTLMSSAPWEPVLFDAALQRAIKFAQAHSKVLGKEPLLVRDIYGRISIAIDDRDPAYKEIRVHLPALAAQFHAQLGAYSPGESESDVFLLASERFCAADLFDAPDIFSIPDSDGVRLLEQQLVGKDWQREAFPKPTCKRAAFYGVKGGVGRSTALAMLAKHLAEKHDQRVLVLDLDLESPGISSMLLPERGTTDLGLVDYLVEQAVGQGDQLLVRRLSAESPLFSGAPGWIKVVPAHGADAGDYLAKLSRIYQGVPSGPSDFAARLNQAISWFETQLQPDVVLLDSRAGLHDIAAVTITRLHAQTFLFAGGTPQTLAAYKLLFAGLHRHPNRVRDYRDNLQLVASLVPETNRTPYLQKLKTGFYDLFADNFYDDESELLQAEPSSAVTQVSSQSIPESFNYSQDDPDAPHHPIPINWYRWFLDFDPMGNPEAWQQSEIDAAFGTFLTSATKLLLKR